MVARPVTHEWGLFVWALDDGTGIQTGHFRDDPSTLAAWITERFPGPVVLRGPGAERIAAQMGGQACLDPTPGDSSEMDRELSAFETDLVTALPRLLVATDGSADNDGHVGLGWVGSDGRYSAGGWRQRGRRQVNALRAEIAAVVSAMDAVHTDRRLELMIDSRTVLADVELAMSGKPVRFGSRFPTRTLHRLAVMDVRASWVKGHQGHGLNETADQLATYARRCAIAGIEPRRSVMTDIVGREGAAFTVPVAVS